MDKLTALLVFRRVSELQSFSGAARALRLSNAAVSKNVRELEQALGARLIHRTTRRLHPTPAGEAYYLRTAAILDDLQQADAAIVDLGRAPRGLLRVAAPLSFGLSHVAPAIGRFLATHPEVQVDLQLNDRYVDLVHEARRGLRQLSEAPSIRRTHDHGAGARDGCAEPRPLRTCADPCSRCWRHAGQSHPLGRLPAGPRRLFVAAAGCGGGTRPACG
jgi:DNA-binding transcriptional LysR family regulator